MRRRARRRGRSRREPATAEGWTAESTRWAARTWEWCTRFTGRSFASVHLACKSHSSARLARRARSTRARDVRARPGSCGASPPPLYFVAVFHRMVLGVAALEAERRYHVGPGALSAFTAIQ